MGGRSCAEAGCKNMAGETVHRMTGGEGGVSSIGARNNKRQGIGPEW